MKKIITAKDGSLYCIGFNDMAEALDFAHDNGSSGKEEPMMTMLSLEDGEDKWNRTGICADEGVRVSPELEYGLPMEAISEDQKKALPERAMAWSFKSIDYTYAIGVRINGTIFENQSI